MQCMDEITVGLKNAQGIFHEGWKVSGGYEDMKINGDSCQKSFNKTIGECWEQIEREENEECLHFQDHWIR